MKLFITSLFLQIVLATAINDGKNICNCEKYQYKTAPPVTQVNDVAQKVLDRFNEIYRNASDILINALLLNYKGAESSHFQIDQEHTCYELKVKNGVFEVENLELLIDLEMTTIGSDTGPENTICRCVQKNGREKVDFCNVFLRQRIFERITGWACFLANNEPEYCCSGKNQQ